MSGPAPDPDAGKVLPPEISELARVPLLPLEAPLVQAVRSLEALKGQAEGLLVLLQHMPGASDQITASSNTLAEHGNTALAAIRQFQEIRECRGQA